MNRKVQNHRGKIAAILILCFAVSAIFSSTLFAQDPKSGSVLNINRAGVEELSSLPGIGKAKAKAIVTYRTDNGPFASIEDLLSVKGIGTRMLEKIMDLITVEAR